MFIPNLLSQAQFRLSKSSQEQEHVTRAAIVPLLVKSVCTFTQKVKIEVLDAALPRTFKFGAGVLVVCKTAYFILVFIHGACLCQESDMCCGLGRYELNAS